MHIWVCTILIDIELGAHQEYECMDVHYTGRHRSQEHTRSTHAWVCTILVDIGVRSTPGVRMYGCALYW